MDFGLEAIKLFLVEQKISVEEFCKICEISKEDYLMIMDDISNVKLGTIFKVLKTIDMSPSQFFKTINELTYDEINKRFNI